jgi:hypothetical protein
MAKFSGFRTLKTAQTVEEVIQYLTVGLSLSLRELQAGLLKLKFEENFDTQTLGVSLPAGATVAYPHNLGVIPSKRLIVRASGSTIDDSSTPWTDTVVYFRNSGGSTITATIILMR